MGRYLTPAKIGLLCLVELYADGAVPSSATVAVLAFILNEVLPATGYSGRGQLPGACCPGDVRELPVALDVKPFEALLAPHPAAHALPGRGLWDLFLEKLWRIDSLHALHDFFARRATLLVKRRAERQHGEQREQREQREQAEQASLSPAIVHGIKLSRTSPLGSFVRQAAVEFEKLRFSDTQSLWTAFGRWRYTARTLWTRRYALPSPWAGDEVLDVGAAVWGTEATRALGLIAYGRERWDEDGVDEPASTADLERLLEFQIDRIQARGERAPTEVSAQLRRLLSESSLVPSKSHYLSSLTAWKAGDYTTALDQLHRYFDYTMQHQDRLFYQYALMSLATLHADFGCVDEAVATMLETVSTARENHDTACLNYALHWLYQFSCSHPTLARATGSADFVGSKKESLALLRCRAKEAGMWALWSTTLLSEAKLGMAAGESVAVVWENLLKSSYLAVEKNLPHVLHAQMAVAGHAWNRLGQARLGRQYSEVFLGAHARAGLVDDALRHTCRLALCLTLEGQYDAAMQRLDAAMQRRDERDPTVMQRLDERDPDAMQKLDERDPDAMRSWRSDQYWLTYKAVLRLVRDLHHHDLDGAGQLLEQLRQQIPGSGDAEIVTLIEDLHIDYLTRRGEYGTALSQVEKMAAPLRDAGDVSLLVRLLTWKAYIHDKCGRPQKGFSVAVRAANVAWRARLLAQLWTAVGAIANILTSLAEFQASADLLVAILPRALECRDRAMSARLYSYLVDACMGLAGREAAGSARRRAGLRRCLEYIDSSFCEYSAVEDVRGRCEMMAKKATLLRALGDLAQANDCVSAYHTLRVMLWRT